MDSSPSNDLNYNFSAKRQKLTTTNTKAHELGVMRRSTSNGSASFLGSSSGIHFIRVVYNAFARRSAHLHQSQEASKDSQVPGEDDQLHHDHHSSDLWLPHEINIHASDWLPFETLVGWCRNYFDNWHPMFPFLSGPTFLGILECMSQDGFDNLSTADAILIRSIISISMMDRRQSNVARAEAPVPPALVFDSLHQAMESLHTLFCDPPTIPILQAAFSIQLFLVSLLRLNAASRIGGFIIRTAFHLGLHRCPVRFSCFNPQEACMRRRVFWSIYCLDRYLSQALGIPLGIRDDDIDVCYPNAERHGPVDEDHRLRLLSHLAKFSRVRGRIVELRNKSILHRCDDSTDAIQVHSELTQWWNEVYEDVFPSEENGEERADPVITSTLTPFHRLLLTVLRHESILSMNRPLLASGASSSPEYQVAIQTCIESSRSIITDLHQYLSSSDGPKSSTPLIWPSFTWAVWMSSLILIYAAWEDGFPVTSASRCAKSAISILQALSQRGNTWPQIYIEAIRDLNIALTGSANPPPSAEKSTCPTTTIDSLPSSNAFDISHPIAPLTQHNQASSGENLLHGTNNVSQVSVNDNSNNNNQRTQNDSWSLIFGDQLMNHLGPSPGISEMFPMMEPGNIDIGFGDLWSFTDGHWLNS